MMRRIHEIADRLEERWARYALGQHVEARDAYWRDHEAEAIMAKHGQFQCMCYCLCPARIDTGPADRCAACEKAGWIPAPRRWR